MKPLNPYYDLFIALKDQSQELQLSLRKKLIWAYAWAIPGPEAIEAIAAHGPIIELGAGNGYWAWLLAQAGVDVVAYDHAPEQVPKWFAVQAGDASVVREHPERALLLVWPPLNEPMACEALSAYTGKTLIYVGEWGGRTGSFAFHEALERDWQVVQTLEIPCWPGFSDQVFVLSRR